MRATVLFSILGLALLASGVAPAVAEPVSGLEAAKESVERHRRALRDLVRERLASADDREVAWGATWARELGLRGLVPELAASLRRTRLDPEAVDFRTRYALLDALLRLDARLGADDLRPLVEGRSRRSGEAAAVALAVRGGDPHVVLSLFEVFDDDDDSWEEAWTALGNTLSESAVPGFAARLLRRLEVVLTVTVRDPDSCLGFGGSGQFGLCCGDGSYPEAEGYPPVWSYDLTRYAREGAVLLADGPEPIYLERRLVRRGFGSTSRMPQERNRLRFAWLADRIGKEPEVLPLTERHAVSISWAGAEAFRADLQAARDDVLRSFRGLAALLLDRGDVAPHEIDGWEPAIHLVLSDQRGDAAEPLPEVPEDAAWASVEVR